MILSKENKFLFVKGSKVAGTSLEVLLSNICGPKDIITPITPVDEKYRLKNCKYAAQNYGADTDELKAYLEHIEKNTNENLSSLRIPKGIFYNHMPLTQIINNFGEVQNDWYIFAIERSPYRKIISRANMSLNFSKYQATGQPMQSELADLKTEVTKIIEDKTALSVKNIDLYKNAEGKVCTEILKFEKLDLEIKNLMRKLNIDNPPKLAHLKKGMGSNNIELNEVFSKQQINKINELFEDEFTAYGYEMLS